MLLTFYATTADFFFPNIGTFATVRQYVKLNTFNAAGTPIPNGVCMSSPHTPPSDFRLCSSLVRSLPMPLSVVLRGAAILCS